MVRKIVIMPDGRKMEWVTPEGEKRARLVEYGTFTEQTVPMKEVEQSEFGKEFVKEIVELQDQNAGSIPLEAPVQIKQKTRGRPRRSDD